MKFPVILPNGDLIHGSEIASINHFVGSGLAIKGENGNSLAYLKEDDEAKAKHIRSELIKLVVAINNGEKYKPNFHMPKQFERTNTDKAETKN